MTIPFSKLHPLVNFAFFVSVIVFSMICMNPVMLGISCFSATVFLFVLKGTKAIRKVLFSFVAVLIVSVVNVAFNHQGATIILYVNDNPITLESAYYGLASGVMFISVILWFSCYNAIMTSDKIMFLFGKMLPSLSLIFAMILRFVPRFCAQAKRISAAQRSIGKGISGNLPARLKKSLSILTALLSWSLENAIDTADSMKCRGYGLPGRTAFSNYRFTVRDTVVITLISLMTVCVIVGNLLGAVYTAYFPVYSGLKCGTAALVTEICYLLLFNIPVILSVSEGIQWKFSESRI